ncbi:GNAT family N-acetyltransferase [Rhodobacteraceae bacterium NNCM2]|nr:GNAT family N-acetyltransferase [Coraliihabitans acroporae]
MTEIPTLETERLILRAPRLDDFEPYAAFYASDRSVWEDGPFDRARAWKEFATSAALWHFRGYGAFSVEDRASGAYLGEVGLFRPAHYPETELGWMVVPEAEGKGIAREAALCVRDWAFEAHGLSGLVNYIDPGNARSIALAERLGARLDTDAAEPAGEKCVVYRHPAMEEIS